MTSELVTEFVAWPKTARLNRAIVVTEKIDGTNAAVGIRDDLSVYAQSRTRVITPEQDNHGFARWVAEHAEPLASLLGAGLHFGEWWGSGVQRGYGLSGGEKRFSLFNTLRHEGLDFTELPTVSVVPVLYQGPFSQAAIEGCLKSLTVFGSMASPGFMDPEGVCIFHTAARSVFKVTIKGDDVPKGADA